MSDICSRCDDEVATIKCPACGYDFCASCDMDVHKRGKLSEHNRFPLDDLTQSQAIYLEEKYLQEEEEEVTRLEKELSVLETPKNKSTSPIHTQPTKAIPPNQPSKTSSIPQQTKLNIEKTLPIHLNPQSRPPVGMIKVQKEGPPLQVSPPPTESPNSLKTSVTTPKQTSVTTPTQTTSNVSSQNSTTTVANNGPKPNYKLVMVGTGGVGKSAITIQMVRGTFTEDEYDPTIEDSYKKDEVIDGQPCMLDILDTAGQEEYASLRDNYMRVGHGFIVVYAINSRATFEEVDNLKEAILRAKDAQSVPMILVGNKCDLEHERKVSKQEGQQLATTLGCAFLEVSAKANLNVKEIFHDIVREIRKAPVLTEVDPKKKKKPGEKCILQ